MRKIFLLSFHLNLHQLEIFFFFSFQIALKIKIIGPEQPFEEKDETEHFERHQKWSTQKYKAKEFNLKFSIQKGNKIIRKL